MSEIKLKKGDKVVMHTCLESKGKNLGKIWTCHTDSFKCEAGIEVVFLEGFSGFFYTKFLQPVKIPETKKDNTPLSVILDSCRSSFEGLEHLVFTSENVLYLENRLYAGKKNISGHNAYILVEAKSFEEVEKLINGLGE